MAKSKIKSALAEVFEDVESRGDGAYFLKKAGVWFLYRPYRVLSSEERKERGRVDLVEVVRQLYEGHFGLFSYVVAEGKTLGETVQDLEGWLRKFQRWSPQEGIESLPPEVRETARGVLAELYCLLHDQERPRARPKAPTLDPSIPAIKFDFRKIGLIFELDEEFGMAAFIVENGTSKKMARRSRAGRAMVAKGTSSLVLAEGLIAAGQLQPSAARSKWRR